MATKKLQDSSNWSLSGCGLSGPSPCCSCPLMTRFCQAGRWATQGSSWALKGTQDTTAGAGTHPGLPAASATNTAASEWTPAPHCTDLGEGHRQEGLPEATQQDPGDWAGAELSHLHLQEGRPCPGWRGQAPQKHHADWACHSPGNGSGCCLPRSNTRGLLWDPEGAPVPGPSQDKGVKASRGRRGCRGAEWAARPELS